MMGNRHIDWSNFLFILLSLIIVTIPLAVGRIPVYDWFGFSEPSSVIMWWLNGVVYSFIIIFGLCSLVSVFFYIFDFIFPKRDSEEEE